MVWSLLTLHASVLSVNSSSLSMSDTMSVVGGSVLVCSYSNGSWNVSTYVRSSIPVVIRIRIDGGIPRIDPTATAATTTMTATRANMITY